MILQEHANNLKSNVKEVKSQEFGIGDASVIIDILRNRLYEHKVRTLVQEYICNARDAMREAGNTGKLTVTIPNKLSPTFKVRDYGLGITPDRMQNVFVLYGASTKRDSNNQTGGFGIGAKSAWSYTDSFTIITHIDGTKRTYVAHTGVNNNGRLDLINTTSTTEKNGTEIQIAVNPDDLKEFEQAVYRTIFFWETKPELKGLADTPDLNLKETHKIDNLTMIRSSNLPECVTTSNDYYSSSNPILVIDGVPYSIEGSLIQKCESLQELRNLINKSNLILEVEVGVVEVAASRESIADSKVTINAINKLCKALCSKVQAYLKSEFEAVKSVSEFMTTYTKLAPHYKLDDFAAYSSYYIKGETICSTLFKNVHMTRIDNYARRSRYYRGRKNKKIYRHEAQSFALAEYENLFYLDAEESKIVQNKRIKEYLTKHEELIIFQVRDGNTSWLNRFRKELDIKKFTDIQYPIVPKQKHLSPKIKRDKTEFCVHTFSGSDRDKVHVTVANNNQKWLWVSMTKGSFDDYQIRDLRNLNVYLRNEKSDYRICGLSKESQGLTKNDSNFKPLKDYLKALKATPKTYACIKREVSLNRHSIDTIKDFKNLDDEFLVKMIQEYSTFSKAFALPVLISNRFKTDESIKQFKERDKRLHRVFKNTYILLKDISMYWADKKEVVIYMNAKYKLEEGV